MTYTNGIPSISDYSHWNEDAQRVWYEENKYDMEHPEVFDDYMNDLYDNRTYADEALIDPEECAREYNHSYNTHTRNGMVYCTDCDTELGAPCAKIVSNEWGEGPCGWHPNYILHVNEDDSRAIDHEYVAPK